MERSVIQKFKNYFESRDDVLMAFLFGSHAKGYSTKRSDWDVGVYLKPQSGMMELDTGELRPERNKIWGQLSKLLGTDEIDVVILNSSSPSIADIALKGMPLVVKNRKLFLDFWLAVSREAEDYRQTVKEYYDIFQRSQSLNDADAEVLRKRILFLESELKDFEQFRALTQADYQDDKDKTKKRNVERWVENVIMSVIDIAKAVLASKREPVPGSYREIVTSACLALALGEKEAHQWGEWTKLRNLTVHEYLDLRWQEIKFFIDASLPYFDKFLKAVKIYLEQNQPSS